MVVFANLNGKLTELGDHDLIENELAEIYVNSILSKNELNTLNKFLSVSHLDLTYHVHISQIQWACDRDFYY